MSDLCGPFHPARHAAATPDKPAVVMFDSGDTVTYADLAARSARVARLLAERAVGVGDHVAFLMENNPRLFEVCWGVLRRGCYGTPISTHLTAGEAAYIVDNAGARALITSVACGELASDVVAATNRLATRLVIGGELDGFESFDGAVAPFADDLLPDEMEGSMMLYSSGTTGRPKGIKKPLSGKPAGSSNPLVPFQPYVELSPDTVYLCPAPLYHAAPLGWSLGTQRFGGTVVVLDRFDPEDALRAIERHRVTHVQLVPTMFVRMLKLPDSVRAKYDVSSLRKVVHASAPCPPEVKERMIAWLGPIVDEYYSGTEGSGITYITAPEWLAHRGSVGRPILGTLSITDDDGEACAPRVEGTIWFTGGETYEYKDDPEATAAKRDRRGWTTLEDVGYVDEDGYLYLTDRRAHMIVSGGVNIYPQEAEDVLTMHPKVDDVAVIGVPDAEMGEAVKAVVVAAVADPGETLATELLEYCRARLAHYKCPRSVDFVESLPRLPTGKLAKRLLKDEYWSGHATRIV